MHLQRPTFHFWVSQNHQILKAADDIFLRLYSACKRTSTSPAARFCALNVTATDVPVSYAALSRTRPYSTYSSIPHPSQVVSNDGLREGRKCATDAV